MVIDYEKGGTQKDIYVETEVINVSCPLCGKDKHKEIYKERGSLGVVRCDNCNLIYVSPRLKDRKKSIGVMPINISKRLSLYLKEKCRITGIAITCRILN